MNGTDVIIQVNTGTVAVPVWTSVGKQQGAKLSEKVGYVDESSKDAMERAGSAGRYEGTLSLDALYVPDDTAFTYLKTSFRAGTKVQVQVVESGTATEVALAVITQMDTEWPDQDAATISATFEIDGAWAAAV